jgi:hypothetical protein
MSRIFLGLRRFHMRLPAFLCSAAGGFAQERCVARQMRASASPSPKTSWLERYQNVEILRKGLQLQISHMLRFAAQGQPLQ